ncbi:hypothetical protein PQZ71_00705 [Candidatus Pelagibacter sp.]|nr:hypothetical protein [Candidatus Pelagibacter sp.]
MRKLKLPKFFKYNQCEDLTRIGGKYDGGYLISETDIEKSDVLLSFGIDVDWKFERDFFRIKEIPIYSYDASTNFPLFIKRAIGALLRYDFKKFFFFLVGFFKFKKFFTGKKNFIPKFVGLENNKYHLSLNEVISETDFLNYFLKMDIEGSEYRCLDDLIKHQDKISGIVIEFHDIDLHLNKIEEFISKFNLKIVHIHINNWTLVGKNDLPLLIEVTFSKHGKTNNDFANYPHTLDSPNSTKLPNFVVSFNE